MKTRVVIKISTCLLAATVHCPTHVSLDNLTLKVPDGPVKS